MTLAKIYTNTECVLIDLDKICSVKVACKAVSESVYISAVIVSFGLSQSSCSSIDFPVKVNGSKYCLHIGQYSGKAEKLVNGDLFERLTKKQTDINIQDIVMTAIYKLIEIDNS